MKEIDPYPCGPKSWPDRLRKWLSPAWAKPGCYLHDDGYVGGDRKLEDAQFRRRQFEGAFGDKAGEGHVGREIYAFAQGMGVTFLGWAFKTPRKPFWKKKFWKKW